MWCCKCDVSERSGRRGGGGTSGAAKSTIRGPLRLSLLSSTSANPSRGELNAASTVQIQSRPYWRSWGMHMAYADFRARLEFLDAAGRLLNDSGPTTSAFLQSTHDRVSTKNHSNGKSARRSEVCIYCGGTITSEDPVPVHVTPSKPLSLAAKRRGRRRLIGGSSGRSSTSASGVMVATCTQCSRQLTLSTPSSVSTRSTPRNRSENASVNQSSHGIMAHSRPTRLQTRSSTALKAGSPRGLEKSRSAPGEIAPKKSALDLMDFMEIDHSK